MDKMPPIVLQIHNNVLVVRDDLFPYGSKSRFLDDYFATISQKEVVFGSSPRWGYAQISLGFLGIRHGKRITVFLPKSNHYHLYTQRAVDLGVNVVQVNPGYLVVTEKRAKDYAKKVDGLILPIGLDCPEAVEGINKVARSLNIDPEPEEVWTVASSGTLTRGLQKAFPNADFYAVQVGRELKQEYVGKAKIIKYPLPFNKPAKNPPPFPSAPEYDAKVWEFVPKDGKKVRLVWNVGA